MNQAFTSFILTSAGASSFEIVEELQELWSGYGHILRLRLQGASRETVIAKEISLPTEARHPRGWNTDRSHQRKVRSYQVESHWYEHYNARLSASCRTPRFLAQTQVDHETILLLEDLDAAGYPARLSSLSLSEVELCLRWLAEFHATFLKENATAPEGLWAEGTYWHLDTRPDEWAALDEGPLKTAAPTIAAALKQARYQTLVHGDAKLANFCFSPDSQAVAALDFQYVGGGCGMKDVAYFLGSCLDESVLETQEASLLNGYFSTLQEALAQKGEAIDTTKVIKEWRELYPYAWADFHRFLTGWSPTHWKLNAYSKRIMTEVLHRLRI